MSEHKEKLGNIMMMVKEITNKDQTLKWDSRKERMLFNYQDVTDEMGLMVDAFIAQDAKKMGFILADTLYEHLKKQGKNVPVLLM